MPKCGDTVKVKSAGKVIEVCCARETGHPVEGVNSNARRYEFHRGDGWVWDERVGWVEGQEPRR